MLIAGNGYSVLSKFVFDGDTLNLNFQGEPFGSAQGKQFLARLQWIDTPETRKPSIHTNTDPRIQAHWSWAERAKTALMNLVYQKPLICIPIKSRRTKKTDSIAGYVTSTSIIKFQQQITYKFSFVKLEWRLVICPITDTPTLYVNWQ